MEKLERVFRSIEFIENNLNREISLKDIAERAYMSPFHFHRIFQALSGVSVGVYIRMRKLSKAADSLTESSRRILEIAMDWGYESQEAFSRAFKKQFRVTPAEFRKKDLKKHFNYRNALTLDSLKHLSEGVTMKPEIRIIKPFTAVGLEAACTQKNGGVAALWAKFVPRMGELGGNAVGSESYGVCQYVDVSNFTDETEFREFVCRPVSNDSQIPEGMVAREVKGGRFAVFSHRGSVEKLQDTYNYIYGSWVLKSEYEVDERDDMEMYDHRFNPADPENSLMFIFIPIK